MNFLLFFLHVSFFSDVSNPYKYLRYQKMKMSMPKLNLSIEFT